MLPENADLVVVGAGPTGLAAACEARQFGLSVVLLDEQAAAGGQIYRAVDAAPAARRAVLGEDYAAGAELITAFARSGALHVSPAMVWNVNHDLRVEYLRDGKSRAVQGRQIVLASGAMERPFPIPGWTLPGVMGAGAAQVLFKSAGALPTEPVVLAGCGPLLFLLASQYLQAGVQLRAVVHTTRFSDYRRASSKLASALMGWRDLRKGLQMIANLRHHRVPVYAGAGAFAIEGSKSAEAFCFAHRGRKHRIETRLVLLHQGVVPNTQLSWALGARHRWDDAQLCWLPETDADGQLNGSGIYIAGDGRAIVGAKAAMLQGRLAALAAAARLDRISATEHASRARQLHVELRKHLRIRPFLDALYRPLHAHRVPADNVTVCRCEEVPASHIRDLVALGCQGPNQAKAFSRCGMGPCQGRQCGLTVTEVIAEARGVPHEQVGYYRVRFPIKPVTLGELGA